MGIAQTQAVRIVTAVSLVLSLTACHRIQAPASIVHMADPATAGQLIQGFYAVEGTGENSWRWVAPEVALALGPPRVAKNGARLRIRLYFPETQIDKVGPIRLTAFVDGEALAPQTYAKAGNYEFVRDIPQCLLDSNVVPVRLSFYPYAPKSDTEGRILAAVMSMAALEPK
ncbi:MAG TPA: hypothetical protein VFW44_01625 [Bryobacteraceae bacterium]|nr:hypothetical protein [Bryobacteraceae bacterium]